MTIFHYYIKIDNHKYHELYGFNPVKEFMCNDKSNILIEMDDLTKQKMEKKLEKQYEVCCGFNFNDYVYVPQCACLISKYPYIKQMETMLEVLVGLYIDRKYTIDDLYNAILYITREIPIPPHNKRLLFYIPFTNSSIEIVGPIYKDLPLTNNNLTAILELFSIDNIITIQYLMLTEQKLLFISDDPGQLTNVIDSFISLLYPFEWIHTYIPILSEEMIKYLQSFMPFIMGIEEYMLETAKEYLDECEGIYLVYIRKNYIDISSNKKGRRLIKRKELVKDLPDYPYDIETDLTNAIKSFKKIIDKQGNQKDIELTFRKIFIKNIASIVGDYMKYLSFLDDVPLFNCVSYIPQRPKSCQPFCSELIQTQIFRNFLQYESREEFVLFKKYISEVIKDPRSHKRSNSITVKRTQTLSPDLEKSAKDFLETFIILPYYIENPKNDLQRSIGILNERYTPFTSFSTNIFPFDSFKEIDFIDMPVIFNRYIIQELKFKKTTEGGFNSKISSKIRPFVLEIEKKIETQNYEIQYRERRKESIIRKTKRKFDDM
jgi:hypothetical protein